VLFVLLCGVCAAVAIVYVGRRVQATTQPIASAEATDPALLPALLSQPHVIFAHTTDLIHRRLAVAPLDAPESARYISTQPCERVYFSTGNGLCLGSQERYYGNRGARQFDAALTLGRQYDQVQGISTRARVSADGRYGSLTVFVSGDSYAAQFSTRTFILDLTSGRDLGTLEEFTVYRDGAVFQSPDFNFWGTTFAADGNRFYATLGTGSATLTTYLVEGDLARRTMQVLKTNVECPSLSPDGKRIAFKKRIARTSLWRLAVLDLDTLQDTVLDEDRSVDDQVEWLDDDHILYGVIRETPDSNGNISENVWITSVSGAERPRIFLEDAMSPVVVR
jgi:hypothetical protein